MGVPDVETESNDKQKIFFIGLFDFVLCYTFSITVPFYYLFISSERYCQEVYLGQERVGVMFWQKGAKVRGAEEVSKWNFVQHQYRMHWFTVKELNATLEKVTVFWVKWSQAQKYCGSPNLSPHPKQGHSLNVAKFNANNKIRFAGGRFTRTIRACLCHLW